MSKIPTTTLIDIADSVADLYYLLEQINVLADDLCQNYFHHTTAPASRFVRQTRLKTARVKANLLHDQSISAMQKVHMLHTLSKTISPNPSHTLLS